MISTSTGRGRVSAPARDAVKARVIELPPQRALALPMTATVLLLAFTMFGRAQENPRVWWSLVAVAAALLAWGGLLLASAWRVHRRLALEVAIRPQHYVQACAHAAILLYWGAYWPQVYGAVDLLAAQLLFAYAFDMLLAWSRRDACTLGFGPFPIVFSTNLFLWFKPDWFYLQFLMLALGFAAKELIRWERDGRRTHVFNPSSFSLCVFSLALIAAGATDMTWGQEIAVTQFYPPHMYLFLFAIALPGQLLFGVTTMTMSAVVTTYLVGLLYYLATGVYFFYDAYIPIAVFLGMHLLFTDPSTSPRGELGRVIFGALYAISVIVLYRILLAFHIPAFYDKLLPVPLLNLSVRGIERLARSTLLRRFDPARVLTTLRGRRRHLAMIGVWTTAFLVMSVTQGVGDAHRGQWLPFWIQACDDNRANACAYLANVETIFCRAGSGWACNDLGVLETERRGDVARAAASFGRGCRIGFAAACENLASAREGRALRRASPGVQDYPIILKGSKGPVRGRDPMALNELACTQGWPGTCASGGAAQ